MGLFAQVGLERRGGGEGGVEVSFFSESFLISPVFCDWGILFSSCCLICKPCVGVIVSHCVAHHV